MSVMNELLKKLVMAAGLKKDRRWGAISPPAIFLYSALWNNSALDLSKAGLSQPYILPFPEQPCQFPGMPPEQRQQ